MNKRGSGLSIAVSMVRRRISRDTTYVITVALVTCSPNEYLAVKRHKEIWEGGTKDECGFLSRPNEDFGRRNKRGNPDFRSTFQGREYSIWATNH
jgi:hypothetical protein